MKKLNTKVLAKASKLPFPPPPKDVSDVLEGYIQNYEHVEHKDVHGRAKDIAEWVKELGIGPAPRMSVYRGVRVYRDDWKNLFNGLRKGEVRLWKNPIESWSYAPLVAASFGDAESAISILMSRSSVPRDKIIFDFHHVRRKLIDKMRGIEHDELRKEIKSYDWLPYEGDTSKEWNQFDAKGTYNPVKSFLHSLYTMYDEREIITKFFCAKCKISDIELISFGKDVPHETKLDLLRALEKGIERTTRHWRTWVLNHPQGDEVNWGTMTIDYVISTSYLRHKRKNPNIVVQPHTKGNTATIWWSRHKDAMNAMSDLEDRKGFKWKRKPADYGGL